MDINVIIVQMIKFFIQMGLGYFLFKVNIMDSDFNKKLTNLALRVTMPCLMVSSAFSAGEDRDLGKVLFVFLVAIIVYASFIFIGMLIVKVIRIKIDDAGMYVFMTIFGNVGFMGFPLTEALLGEEAVFYVAIFNMIFNILIFTVGIKAMNYPESSADHKMSFKDIILHPGIVSAIVAIIIYFIKIPLPGAVTGAISSIGSVTTPIAMLLMGASLAKLPVKSVFNDAKVYIFSLIKLVVIPVLSWLIIKNCIKDEIIAMITLVMIAMPVANSAVMFAIEYEKDEEIAAKNVFISTVLTIISIPVVIYLTSIL